MHLTSGAISMWRVTRAYASIGLAVLLVGLTNAALGQVPDSAKIFTATLVGRIVDTSGTVVAGAEVVVARVGDSAVVGTATSNKKGVCALNRLPAGSSFTGTALNIG